MTMTANVELENENNSAAIAVLENVLLLGQPVSGPLDRLTAEASNAIPGQVRVTNSD
jgi:hypothetical protein